MPLLTKTRNRCSCSYEYVPGSRRRKCPDCGAARLAKRRPKHLAALDQPYEVYVQLNGGEQCGVCGRPATSTRRLDRDHDHLTGKPRGLLCWAHNRLLDPRWTPDDLRAAAEYLERGYMVAQP
jgi:DNA-directed RNA polymerase subunit RPC12/RpoP